MPGPGPPQPAGLRGCACGHPHACAAGGQGSARLSRSPAELFLPPPRSPRGSTPVPSGKLFPPRHLSSTPGRREPCTSQLEQHKGLSNFAWHHRPKPPRCSWGRADGATVKAELTPGRECRSCITPVASCVRGRTPCCVLDRHT